MPRIRDEISKIVPEWQVLEQAGSAAYHTIFVMYLVTIDPVYINEYDQDQKNISLWAALLHDIKKRGAASF